MTKTDRENHFDFIEFPAKSLDDFAKAKAFYTSVFGWTYQDWGNNYSDTKNSGLGCGLNADPAHHPSHPLAVIYSSDLGSARTKVFSAGGTITRDIFSFPGGRRFHFTDPAGNELAVWSDR